MLRRKIDFLSLGLDRDLPQLLQLPVPSFPYNSDAFGQVRYLENYIRRPDINSAKARSIAVESHYVDRDFMSDHSVLFSNMLESTKNYCQRVHFFAGEPDLIQSELAKISKLLAEKKPQKDVDMASDSFSEKHYLGFAVIRPLPGCPVGRTVLRVLPAEKAEDGSRRILTCSRTYRVHLMGLTLNVRGLAFQQQDLGVSRCATIALWCALHKVTESEPTGLATPSEITNLASRYRLPFGRPMPSEGLNPEQMCLALQSLGISPFVVKAGAFAQARCFIYSATLSALPCVLIISNVKQRDIWHAVTVVGMKVAGAHTVSLVDRQNPSAGDDLSGDLKALYVQDDRLGPYRRAEVSNSGDRLRLTIKIQSHVPNGESQDWFVEQILLPLHQKIRVGITELMRLARRSLIPEIQLVVAGLSGVADVAKWIADPTFVPPVQFSTWIERGHLYTRRVLNEHLLDSSAAADFQMSSILSRYVAVLRFASEKFGQIDVLLDTTSPRPNYHWIGVLAAKGHDEKAAVRRQVGEYVAAKCACEFFW